MKNKIFLLLLCSATLCRAVETSENHKLLADEQPPEYTAASSSRVANPFAASPVAHPLMHDPRDLTVQALRDSALSVIDREDLAGVEKLVNCYAQNTTSRKRDIMRAIGACSLAAALDNTGRLDYHLSIILEPDATHPELTKYQHYYQSLGKYRKLTHKEYLTLAAQKGFQQAQTDFLKHFQQEEFNTVVQHPIHQAFIQIVAHRNTTPADSIYRFIQDSLLSNNGAVLRSEVRALGLAYYLTYAHQDKYYGLDVFARLAQTSNLVLNLSNEQKLAATKEYYDAFPNASSRMRYAWALEKNKQTAAAFKTMRVAALYNCDPQAHQETSRLGNIVAIGDTKCCFSSCCCCYSCYPCFCCACDDCNLYGDQKFIVII